MTRDEIKVINRIHKRTKHLLRDNLVLIVGALSIAMLAASIALLGCPELDWCMIDWRRP